MGIFDFALSFEQEHEEFYRKQLEETEHESLKRVYEFLASEEARHQEIVKELSTREEAEEIESNLIPRVKKAFNEISSDIPESMKKTEQVDIYKQAREMEDKAHKFYSKKAEKEESTKLKEVLEKLAAEEKKHWTIMNNLVEMVNRPNTWLDDAEWYHREDY